MCLSLLYLLDGLTLLSLQNVVSLSSKVFILSEFDLGSCKLIELIYKFESFFK